MCKQHLGAYLGRLATGQYDSKMHAYLDIVGKIHTAKAGNPDVVIPLVQMNAFMGFVNDALIGLIFTLAAPECRRVALGPGFNKAIVDSKRPDQSPPHTQLIETAARHTMPA